MEIKWFESPELQALAKSGQPLDGQDICVRKYGTDSSIEKMDGNDRRFRFTFSDASVDRDNDIVSQDGWDLSAFRKNPVILWAHDHKTPAIGRAVELSMDGEKLVGTIEFADHPFADMIRRLVAGGFIKAVSVGFRCKEYKINQERGGIDFLRNELLETSVCNVPANANALVAASAAGIDLAPMVKWVNDTIEQWPDTFKMTDGAMAKAVVAAKSADTGTDAKDGDATDEKAVGKYQDCGYTVASKGATAPEHVHDYSVYRDGDKLYGHAYQVADHSHRITAESFARGETEASDGHVHRLMTADEAKALMADAEKWQALRSPGASKSASVVAEMASQLKALSEKVDGMTKRLDEKATEKQTETRTVLRVTQPEPKAGATLRVDTKSLDAAVADVVRESLVSVAQDAAALAVRQAQGRLD